MDHVVLTGLSTDIDYSRKVIPHLKEEYFTQKDFKAIFKAQRDYIMDYNALANEQVLEVELEDSPLSDDEHKSALEFVSSIKSFKKHDTAWLVDRTEKWVKERALYLSIMESVDILTNKPELKNSIPEKVSDALSVTFDTSVGHAYFDDAEMRHEFYHVRDSKIPCDLQGFMRHTGGGVSRKTLNILMSVTNGAKTLTKCHLAASALRMGKNVLYITNEEREEKIALRIDGNMFNMDMEDVRGLNKSQYMSKIKTYKNKLTGQLIIKEYPTATATALDFKNLLEELAMKKNFKPDIIFVDYINICRSSRVMNNGNNSYAYIKSIAEELRGLAVEYDVPIWSSTQSNRGAYGNSNAGLENTSESMGLSHTVDLFISIFSDEDMDERNLIKYKVLKTRYGQNGEEWYCNIDRPKMKLSDYGDTYSAPDPSTIKSKRPVFNKPTDDSFLD